MIFLINSLTKHKPDFHFPRDEGRHANALHEWWYLNAHLETNTGRRFGLFVSFLPKRIYFFLVDKSGKKIVKRFLTETTLKASNSFLHLETGNNRWHQASDRPFHYTLNMVQDGISLNLELLSCKPPLFINQSGNIRLGLLGSTRYYALTNMKASGTLQLNTNKFEVRGIGWMDRQWGNWDYGGIGGWNWFSIQLSNNVEILIGEIFHPLTGNLMSTLFNMIDNKGKIKVYDKFKVERLKTWRSPNTNSIYGSGWKLTFSEDTKLLISPIIEDQEIIKGFWEGCCEVEGIFQGQRIQGFCYNEQNVSCHANPLVRLFSLGIAPLHYIGQLLFRRVDFKVRKLLSSLRSS